MSDARDKARLKLVVKKADKARKFGINTCPASRHAHLMADTLAKGQKYHMFEEEPEHCAETLYSVITSLWEARDLLIKLQGHWGDRRPLQEQMDDYAAKIDEMMDQP